MTSAQAIVECIKLEGIDRVFCVPGESYLDVLDALYDEPSIQLIANRHEGGAAFMAEAYGKATGKPGIAMATRGVGAANLAIGVHTARQDSTPMVVFLGQVERPFRGREGFQEVELDQFFGPISKWAVEINDPHRTTEIVQRAFRIAKTGRPGPVVVSLPADLLSQTAEMHFGPVSKPPRPRPSQHDIETFFAMVGRAKKPLIIAGGGIKSAQAEDELLHFAETVNIPVLAAFRRHDVFPNTHRLFVGHSGLGTFQQILNTIREADTIIAIGTRFSEITTQGYTVINAKQTIIHIDIDPQVLGQVYEPDLGITADAKEALQDLLQACPHSLDPHLWSGWSEQRRRVYEEVTRIEEAPHSDRVDMKQIIRLLEKHLPADTIFTNDAGNFSGWLHSFYPFKAKNSYVGPTSGAMGYGLPAAVGVKLAHPERTVVSLSGDGGFLMTMQELETAVRYAVPIIAIVFNNQMYGTIRMHQEKMFPARVIGTDLGNPNFVQLGQAFGLRSYTVQSDVAFETVITEAVRLNEPVLIEVVTDPEVISVQATISGIREKSNKS